MRTPPLLRLYAVCQVLVGCGLWEDRRRGHTRRLSLGQGWLDWPTRWIPPARLRRPLPDVRFDVTIRGGSPVR